MTDFEGRHGYLGAVLLVIAIALLAICGAPAALASPQHPTLDQIQPLVMCPTCDTTLDRSTAPAANRMRVLITQYIGQGKTQQQILDQLVKEYGNDTAILASPPRHGGTAVIWWVPVIAGVLAIIVGVISVLTWRRRGPRVVSEDDADDFDDDSALRA